MDVLKNYVNAKEALLEHVGLEADWVECPIDDCSDYKWFIEAGTVTYAREKEDFDSGNYYQDDIYTQRFYPQHVYRGEKYTLIFCDPHVDACQWWRIFLNDNEIK